MSTASGAPKPITILSVEDHPVFREGLSTIISAQPDMRLVAVAATAHDAMVAFRQRRPDVTLMDVRLAGTNGIDALAAILQEFPDARVIVLTTVEGDAEIKRALRAGAVGYVLESAPPEDLLAAVRTVHGGRRAIPPDVAARLAAHFADDDLTRRELDVLGLIRDGHPYVPSHDRRHTAPSPPARTRGSRLSHAERLTARPTSALVELEKTVQTALPACEVLVAATELKTL